VTGTTTQTGEREEGFLRVKGVAEVHKPEEEEGEEMHRRE